MVKVKRGLILGTTAAMLASIVVVGAGIHLTGQASLSDNNQKNLIDEVWQIIDKTYVDGTFNQVDWQAVRKEYLNRSYTNNQQAYEAIREMLGKLDDPYTRFMDPEEFKNMQIDTSGELTGVGIQLSQDEKTKQLIVIAPIEDTPAFDAGVQPQDLLLKIDGKSTEGMNLNDAVKLIRGPVGTSVKLTLQRGNKQLDFDLKRAKIEIHPVKFSVESSNNGKIGYIRLNQFSANASSEMRDAINKLQNEKVVGYILDLRSNPGGLLYASIDIAKMWLSKGDIVSTVNRVGVTDRQKANSQALTDKPLVILVDGGSASASEILSGALQDNKRAVLVGTKTFGKGLVQSVRQVGENSGLAVTIAKYFTPSGRDINHEGIKPDVEVNLTDEQKEYLRKDRSKIGTINDPQYAEALKVLNQEIASEQLKKAQTP